MPELLLLSGGTPVLRCPLYGQPISVGKSAANDIALPDDDAPPLLCSFEPAASGRYRVIARAGSSLHIGGAEVRERVLEPGDEVSLGRLVARFLADPRADEPVTKKASQRTGILKTRGDGALCRVDLRLRLPAALGGSAVDIPEQGLRIGADADNDLVIDDGFVSSFHAQVFLRGERLFVRDLDSTNGTFVAGVRVIEAEVRPEATLRLGQTELVVEPRERTEKLEPPKGQGPWRCCDLVTSDPIFAKTFALIEKVAPHDATVCVFGETGTGKELVAHAVHRLSARRRGPFVALNCAAIPQSLMESELFGHEKGAFTGADRLHHGVFEQASGGTLFLDEIGELPVELQAKLLRVLETRTLRRVGGRGDIAVDVRVVAATHRDLMQHVKAGKFREDLLHRLYVIPLRLPPLRERKDDIVHLAQHFAAMLSPRDGAVAISPAAQKKLREHPFPGNVRELRNVIQRALILGDGAIIDDKDVQFLPTSLAEHKVAHEVYRAGMTLEEVEKQAFRLALEAYSTAAEAARSLGLPKSTFWRRATALGLLERSEKKPGGGA